MIFTHFFDAGRDESGTKSGLVCSALYSSCCRLHRSAIIRAAASIAAHIATVGSLFRRHAALMQVRCVISAARFIISYTRRPIRARDLVSATSRTPGGLILVPNFAASATATTSIVEHRQFHECNRHPGQLLPQTCPVRASQPLFWTAFVSNLSRPSSAFAFLDSFSRFPVPIERYATRFRHKWPFRNLSLTLEPSHRFAAGPYIFRVAPFKQA